jgi:hypothetical protein
MRGTEEERFWPKVEKTDTCWLWRGSHTNLGYGQFRSNGRNVLAHRWSYAKAKGEIPAGLNLDHLCRTPACVNPDHLEAVTQMVNLRRGKRCRSMYCRHGHKLPAPTVLPNGGQKRRCVVCRKMDHALYCSRQPKRSTVGGRQPKKPVPSHCKNGHAYDEANTLIDTRGDVHCRACARGYGRKRTGFKGRTYVGRYM